MTKKKNSAEKVQIRVYQQKLDASDPAARPAIEEIGTLDDGTIIIIKQGVGPVEVVNREDR
jgi:hypothetical protein